MVKPNDLRKIAEQLDRIANEAGKYQIDLDMHMEYMYLIHTMIISVVYKFVFFYTTYDKETPWTINDLQQEINLLYKYILSVKTSPEGSFNTLKSFKRFEDTVSNLKKLTESFKKGTISIEQYEEAFFNALVHKL